MRALLLCCVFAIAAAGAITLWGRELATGLIHIALERLDIAPHRVEVRTIGMSGLTLGPTQLGGPEGPTAAAIEIGWTPWSLLHGRLEHVRIEGLVADAALKDGTIAIAGLPRGEASGMSWRLPVHRFNLAGAHLALTAGTVSIDAKVDAEIMPGEPGIEGRAMVDAVAASKDTPALRVTAELPTCRLVSDAQGDRFVISGARVALPAHKVTLARVDATLRAGATVSADVAGELRDDSSPARIRPLMIDVHGQHDADALSISGRAASAERGLNLTLDGLHSLVDGQGALTIESAPIRFKADGQQPNDLFPIAGDTLQAVDGTITARATMSWGNAMRSTASVTLDGISFSSGIARISDLHGNLMLSSVLPPRTSTPQRLAATLRVPSMPPMPLDLSFSLPADNRLLVEAATLGAAGGTLRLADVLIEPGRPIETELEISALDLGAMLALIDVDGLSGTGRLDGIIPFRVAPAGIDIKGGRLSAKGPGVVRYTGSGLPAGAGSDPSAAESLQLVRQALADFHYTKLVMTIDRAANGAGGVLINLEGANPEVLDNHPFVLNIRLDANFDRLAAILFDGYAAAERLLRPGSTP